MVRKNISIVAKFEDGKVIPQKLLWEDGREFSIDRIYDIRRAASLKAGGLGLRYTCSIRNKQVYLFKDEDMWFLETSD